MDHDRLEDVATQVAKQLFNSNTVVVDDVPHSVIKTSSSRLRNVTVEEILFMEQNQSKKSKWAQMAKEGHEIIWIFENNEYIGQILDGVVKIF